MHLKIDRKSEAYNRVTAAGFKIRNGELYNCTSFDEAFYRVVIRFRCVCGRTEYMTGYMDKLALPKRYDAAKVLEELGALSVEHLREDGYTEKEIKHIRRAYA